jgi:uncharacterized NAD-dependent epimerase/dehydratase family protein
VPFSVLISGRERRSWMIIPGKYLLFLGDVADTLDAKTACGLKDWEPDRCIGQWRLPACGIDLGLPDLEFAAAHAQGARTLVIGVTPFGGGIAPEWIGPIVEALRSGLNVASGMHVRLETVPEIAAAARTSGRALFDVRFAGKRFPIGSGRKRTGKRMLMVGTDCAVGKKYTALAIARDMAASGFKAKFRATGQTGILIAGEGVPIDATISDFLAGAAETLSPDNDPDHWDVIEGQGSLFHPAYAAVSLGLLHGSQPDAIILCHAAGRRHIDGYPDYALPSLEECIEANLRMARLTNPNVRCAGVSINCANESAAGRDALLRACEDNLGVPCFDPVATGTERLVEHIAATFGGTDRPTEMRA